MGTVTPIQELPEWFDIEKYKSVYSLSHAKLYCELTRRVFLLQVYQHSYELEGDEGSRQFIEDEIKEIFNSPITDRVLPNYEFSRGLVEEPGLNWLFFVNQRIQKALGKELKDLLLSNQGDDCKTIQETLYDHDAGRVHVQNVTPFLVDVRAKDSEIIESFKVALAAHRAKYKAPQAIETEKIETCLSKIKSNRVIPFLDLFLWQKLNNRKLSNAVLARALFPDDWNKSDRDIRDYTAKYASKAIDSGFLSSARSWIKRKLDDEKRSEN